MSRDGAGYVIAAALRLEAHDINEGRGPWLGRSSVCPDCGRLVLAAQLRQFDGYCSASTCGGNDEYIRELNRRAAAEALATLDSNPAVTRARDAADRYILKQRT